jgi:FkbM family methyltransferase
MKNQVVVKNNIWTWPKNDVTSWDGQNESVDLPNYVLPHVKNKNVMVQAGGNCGFILSQFVPHFKTIYTFEPDPINFYCLNQNVTSEHVIKMQACVGNNSKTVQTSQLIREDRPIDIGGVHITGDGYTPTICIDNLNLPACDLIQFDVEGYELEAILGTIETIKKYKPVICLEFCEKWLNRYNTNSENLIQLMEDLNYHEISRFRVDRIFVHK